MRKTYKFSLMIHYYINPHNKHLIIDDEETDSITMVKPFSEGEESVDRPEDIGPVRHPLNDSLEKEPPPKKKRKRQVCRRCKEPGHTTRTCPLNRGDDEEESQPKSRLGVDEATIQRIKDLYAEGRSRKEIKQATGVSFPAIYKYNTMLTKKEPQNDVDDGLDDELAPEDSYDDEGE